MQSENVYRASIRICPSNTEEDKIIEVIEKSLYAEAVNPANVGKINIGLVKDEKCVDIVITADTLSHLRAVINSFLYLVHSVIATIEILKRFSIHA